MYNDLNPFVHLVPASWKEKTSSSSTISVDKSHIMANFDGNDDIYENGKYCSRKLPTNTAAPLILN